MGLLGDSFSSFQRPTLGGMVGNMFAPGFLGPGSFSDTMDNYEAYHAPSPQPRVPIPMEEQLLAQRMIPTMMNPMVQAAGNRASAGVLRSGGNSAKAARQGLLSRYGALRGIYEQAPQYWQRLKNLELSLDRQRNAIDTTSTDAALLSGFFSGGGGQGVGQVGGGLLSNYGNTGTQTQAQPTAAGDYTTPYPGYDSGERYA